MQIRFTSARNTADDTIVGSEIRHAIGEVQRERDAARSELARVETEKAALEATIGRLETHVEEHAKDATRNEQRRWELAQQIEHGRVYVHQRIQHFSDCLREGASFAAREAYECAIEELDGVLDKALVAANPAPSRVASEADVERVARVIKAAFNEVTLTDYLVVPSAIEWHPEARAALAAMGYTLPSAAGGQAAT